ncbi:MAG: hypothetical protein M1608_06325, partial [Candidatus Omnitrophica bacterium]|nr:hypothetical protein [Candidatus Omnitrophota bacterium]
MVKTEIIVEVGCDGGSLTVEGEYHGDIGWRFRGVRNEMALYDDCVEDGEPDDIAGFLEKTNSFDSLPEALKLFDRYPYWIDMYVVEVHPEFVDQVLAEVRSRGGASAEAHWHKALDRIRRGAELNGYVFPVRSVPTPNPNQSADVRRCFLRPLPEHYRAADLLDQAADALLRNDLVLGAQLLRECDFSRLREHCDKVRRINPPIHHRTNNPKYTPLPNSSGPRMPTAFVTREVLARDGYRCRFCGCRV